MNVVTWAERYFKPIGSAKNVDFDCSLTPQLREPMEHVNDGVTSEVDLIKPVQTGGTALGEAVLLWMLAHWARGDVAAYWQSDDAADQRWTKHFERKIRACAPVMARLSSERHSFTKGLVAFPHCNFVMQGAFSDRTVASDSFRGMVLEEVHDAQGGWQPGRVGQCFGRTTGFWDRIVYVISNAGIIGSELHQHFINGTAQHWQVKCPHCIQWHTMHAAKHDDGSGLLYDMAGQPEGEPDYRRLASTVRYHFECGHEIKDNLAERRALSLSGRYSEPRAGADLAHRSYTYEAVSCHDISFISLIREKQAAHAARRRGDPRPWRTYLRERESQFIPSVDRPEARPIVLSSGRKKNREGLPDRALRLAAGDYQRGREGDTPHWWLVIRDFRADGSSMLVWEGRCVDQAELVGILAQHNVEPLCVCLDATYEPKTVVQPLCFSRGYCCIQVDGAKAGIPREYPHADKTIHVYSEPQFLYQVTGGGPSRENPAEEPRFWRLSKWGAMEQLAALRASEIPWEVPEDVSPEYKEHMDAWSYTTRKAGITGEILPTWKLVSDKADDHLFQCEAYITVSAEMEHLIGVLSLPEQVAA